MSPFELVNAIDKELDGLAPRLAAAVNKALMYHGEGRIVTSASGDPNAALTIEESEMIRSDPDISHKMMLSLMEVSRLLEMNSRWRLIVDTKSPGKGDRTELRYTLVRDPGLGQ